MSNPIQDQTTSRSRRPLILLAGLAAVALVVIGGVVWWLIRDDPPAEADLDTAVASVADGDEGAESGQGSGDGAESGASGNDGASGSADGVDGTWTVDTSVGEFSFEDSTGTYVGFRVREELTAIGESEAVGRTPQVAGTITIDGQTVTEAVIEANMAAITTNDSRRDGRVRAALDVDGFPSAAFELTAPIELGAAALDGESVAATATGDLTVHGVTQPVEVDLQAQLADDLIVVVGALDITFADFGVSVPSAPIVLSAEDSGVVELQLFLARS